MGHRYLKTRNRFEFTGLAIVRRVVADLGEKNIFRVASGLTLASLVALVPFVALFFSILHALLPEDALSLKFRSWLFSTFLAENVQQVSQHLENFIEQATESSVGLVSFAVLMPTILSLMLSIEKAFNQIWAVKRSRAFLKRILTFYALLSLGPACLVLLVTIGRWLDLENQLVQLGLGNLTTFLVIVFGLFVTYKLLPHRRVETRPALYSAVVVSVCFLLLRAASNLYFLTFASSSFKDKVYGAMAVLPALCLWIYLIWILILFGVSICVYLQCPRLLDERHDKASKSNQNFALNWRARWTVTIICAITRHFRDQGGAMSVAELSQQLKLTVFDVEKVVWAAVEAEWLVFVECPDGEAVLPARPLEAIDFVELFSLEHDLDLPRHPSDSKGAMSDLIQTLDEIDQSGSELLAEFTVGQFDVKESSRARQSV